MKVVIAPDSFKGSITASAAAAALAAGWVSQRPKDPVVPGAAYLAGSVSAAMANPEVWLAAAGAQLAKATSRRHSGAQHSPVTAADTLAAGPPSDRTTHRPAGTACEPFALPLHCDRREVYRSES